MRSIAREAFFHNARWEASKCAPEQIIGSTLSLLSGNDLKTEFKLKVGEVKAVMNEINALVPKGKDPSICPSVRPSIHHTIIHTYIHMYTHVYVCMCVCMYVCI